MRNTAIPRCFPFNSPLNFPTGGSSRTTRLSDGTREPGDAKHGELKTRKIKPTESFPTAVSYALR